MQTDTRLWQSGSGTRLKICGVRCLDTALELADLGIDAIGLHLFRGRITMEAINSAGLICQWLPDDVSRVILTDLTEEGRIARLVEATGADTVQLQGFPPRQSIAALRERLPQVRIIKTLSSSEAENPLPLEAFVREYEPVTDAFLMDRSVQGGTGEAFDWQLAVSFVNLTTLPVMLAGGLSAVNIGDAVSTVRPYAVDVESGVEGQRKCGRITQKWTSIRKVIAVQRALRAAQGSEEGSEHA
jgi:phosphoribosylanthranilate isomerase